MLVDNFRTSRGSELEQRPRQDWVSFDMTEAKIHSAMVGVIYDQPPNIELWVQLDQHIGVIRSKLLLRKGPQHMVGGVMIQRRVC